MRRRWIQRNGELIEVTGEQRATPRGPFIWDDLPAYQSPVDGHEVRGRRARRDDLKRNRCRPWEGRQQEEKEAARQRGYQEQRFDRGLEEAARRAYHQLSLEKRRLLERG